MTLRGRRLLFCIRRACPDPHESASWFAVPRKSRSCSTRNSGSAVSNNNSPIPDRVANDNTILFDQVSIACQSGAIWFLSRAFALFGSRRLAPFPNLGTARAGLPRGLGSVRFDGQSGIAPESLAPWVYRHVFCLHKAFVLFSVNSESMNWYCCSRLLFNKSTDMETRKLRFRRMSGSRTIPSADPRANVQSDSSLSAPGSILGFQ